MIYLMVFFAGIVEVFVGVIDFKVTQKNRIVFSSITTFIAGVIWYFIIRILVENITNIWIAMAHIVGCAVGCYIGLTLAPAIDKFFYVERRGRKKKGKTIRKRLK